MPAPSLTENHKRVKQLAYAVGAKYGSDDLVADLLDFIDEVLAGREVTIEVVTETIEVTTTVLQPARPSNAKQSKTGFYGVSPTKDGMFSAVIKHKGKRYYLGRYNDAELAGKIAWTKKLELKNGWV